MQPAEAPQGAPAKQRPPVSEEVGLGSTYGRDIICQDAALTNRVMKDGPTYVAANRARTAHGNRLGLLFTCVA